MHLWAAQHRPDFSTAPPERCTRAAAIVVTILLVSAPPGCSRDGAKGPAGRGELSLAEDYRLALREPNLETRARRLIRLSARQTTAGDRSGAATSLEQAERAAAEITDPLGRAHVHRLLAYVLAQAGDRTGAQRALARGFAAADQIGEAPSQIDALARLAGVEGRELQKPQRAASSLLRAEQLSEQITDARLRIVALATIAANYDRIDAKERAETLFATADTLAMSLDDPRHRSDGLVAVASSRLAGDSEAAMASLERASEAARAVRDPYSQAYALLAIAQQYRAAGVMARAAECLAHAERAAARIRERDLAEEAQARVRAAKDLLQ